MGVLEDDEGVRPDDLDEMYELWQNLVKISEQAHQKGSVEQASELFHVNLTIDMGSGSNYSWMPNIRGINLPWMRIPCCCRRGSTDHLRMRRSSVL